MDGEIMLKSDLHVYWIFVWTMKDEEEEEDSAAAEGK
jgi:hypothetical protein